MKKFVLILLMLSVMTPVFSEGWDDYNNIDRMWDGQKPVTNQEFEKVIEALQANQKKKDAKQRKKKIKKISCGGTSLHNSLNPDNDISEIQSLKPEEDGLLLNVPVKLLINGNTLEPGYYKVIAEKDKANRIFLSFYQSQYFKGKIEAQETHEDFGEQKIDFVRIIPYNESFMKIIFGSIDFNAYVFVPY